MARSLFAWRRLTSWPLGLGSACVSAMLSSILILGLLATSATAQTKPDQPPDKNPPTSPPKDDQDPAKPNDESKEMDDADADKPESDDNEGMKSSAEQNRNALPPGAYIAPPRPAEFAINKPLTTDEQWNKWSRGKSHGDFSARVQAGDRDGQSDRIVQDGIREQIYAMSLPALRDAKSERFVLSEIVQGLLRTVRTAAAKKPAGDQRQYRAFILDEIIKGCRELADNQFYVRLNATMLLGNLFIVEASPGTKNDPEFYTPAFDALMEVLDRPGQSEAVKIAAINGLQNAALYGAPSLLAHQNTQLAKKLISELEKPGANEWYQERLCDVLSSIDQVHDLNGQPFIVQALAKVLFDTGRPLCARAAAARALGRAQLDASIDLNVIAYGIADLSRQMIEARNDGKKHVRRWCIANVFLAFWAKNPYEKSRRAGLLDRVEEPTYSKYKKAVTEVWGLVRPMVVEELRHRSVVNVAFPPQVLAQMVEWLKGNTPAQLRVAPGLPPVTTTQVTKVDANGHK
jgi:hypothetical protein